MEFRILGPVEAVTDGTVIDLGAPQLRALLARLLLTPNRVVPTDDLLDALWEHDDEASVRNLRVYVSRLRKALPDPDVVVTRAPGYVLQATPDQIDAARFERLVADGRRLLAEHAPSDAADVLRAALELWRGPALADQRDRAFARPDAVRLDNARLDALEERVEADLACGRHGALAAELRGLVAAHPLRERLWRQRMLAEYRSGQPAEALRTFQDLRQLMGDELGLDPSAEASRLERAILDQDPSLDWQAVTPSPSSPPPTEAPASVHGALRVMLVDDHPLWRTAIRSVLEKDGAAHVVAEAEDGLEAVTLATEAQPDVVLMDLHLPGLTGAEATSRIVAAAPSTRVLMLSSSGEEADVLDAVKAGAAGYLVKTGDGREVVDAVARVSRGEPVFTASLAGLVLDRLRRDGKQSGLRVDLSVRQRELLRTLAAGATVVEAASGMGLDDATVRSEITAIVERLQAAGRDGALARQLQTILFVDVVDSTARIAITGNRAWTDLVGRLQELLDDAVRAAAGRVVKHSGDGALLTFDDPRSALSCAESIMTAVASLDIDIRAGMHTGECEVGVGDVHGLAVHIAARVTNEAAAGEIMVSHTVRDLVMGSEVCFEDRGARPLRGVPGEWRLFALVPAS